MTSNHIVRSIQEPSKDYDSREASSTRDDDRMRQVSGYDTTAICLAADDADLLIIKPKGR